MKDIELLKKYNMYYDECPFLNSHLENGAIQGTKTIINITKKGKLYHMNGWGRVKSRENINFEKGWYNDKLEYIAPITEEEQEFINILLPF